MKTDLSSFSRTLRTLDADGMRPALIAAGLVAILLLVWGGWLVMARVPVYEVSQVARLEVERVHPVAATAGGRVVSSALTLGRDVQAGDVLLEVEGDASAGRDRQTRLTTVTGETAALRRQIADETDALRETRRGSQAAQEAAALQVAAADAAVRLADAKLARLSELGKQGLVSTAEVEGARADSQTKHAELAGARVGIDRLNAEQATNDRERRSRIAALERELVALQGLRADAAYEVGHLRVTAPVAGRLGEVSPLQIGAFVRAGERIASIIPAGDVRAVAEFAPPALGRIQAGQPARVRLDGFPWTQYGRVDAVVTGVATETRDQRVRVELSVRHASDSRIPLQHGMPGAVEVEVERAAPLDLLLRSAGQLVTVRSVASAEERDGAERK
jgi:multidrug resistance efflux pump